MLLRTATGEVPSSPARVHPPARGTVRVGAVQQRWHPDPDEHRSALTEGIRLAAGAGASLVCLQELTLSAYFAVDPRGAAATGVEPEALPGGPTHTFAVEAATTHGVHVHASLYEAAEAGEGAGDGLGFNTAICVAPDGTLVARTRKLHIPITAGYHEDRYFRPGDTGFPVVDLVLGDHPVRAGFPTCWDQWFPELARAYALGGADLVAYPTAIGSEPDHPDFDTQPLWRHVIIGHGIANGLFLVAVNRVGTEPLGDNPPLTFYGSSFISDPYGRVLVEAPRDEPAVLVADLDLDQRRDWLALFPLLTTRRPEAYRSLT